MFQLFLGRHLGLGSWCSFSCITSKRRCTLPSSPLSQPPGSPLPAPRAPAAGLQGQHCVVAAVPRRVRGIHWGRSVSPRAGWCGAPSPPRPPPQPPRSGLQGQRRSLSGALCGAAGLHAARAGRRQLPGVPAAAGAAGEWPLAACPARHLTSGASSQRRPCDKLSGFTPPGQYRHSWRVSNLAVQQVWMHVRT